MRIQHRTQRSISKHHRIQCALASSPRPDLKRTRMSHQDGFFVREHRKIVIGCVVSVGFQDQGESKDLIDSRIAIVGFSFTPELVG